MFRPTLPAQVLHRARPTRLPIPRSPFEPRPARATEGASVDRPVALVGPSEPTSSKAELDSGLTLHYAPPPTAPSYTMGLPTAFTQWVQGQQVELSGEEHAPLLHAKESMRKVAPKWDEATVGKIRELREKGYSKMEIAQELDIPKTQTPLISRVAPLSRAARAKKDAARELQKNTWGIRKQIFRELREKRRTFW